MFESVASVNPDKSTIELVSPFDRNTLSILQNLPGRKWDPKKKIWYLPFTEFHAKTVMNILEPAGFQIDPRIYRKAEGNQKVTVTYFQNRDGLYNFQSNAVDFIHAHNGRTLLGSEMGVGKTIMALGWVRERPDLQRILIVAPATVVFKWKNEVLKWIGPNESVEVITTGKQPLGNSRFVIMSYSILVSQQQSLQALNWDVLILDEAHKVKSQKAQRSRCAKSLSYTHLLLISGTPLINRPEELYNLLNMLNPVEWGDWFGYCQRYCDATKTYWGWDMSGASNLDELKERLKPYMLRYTKQEVLPELPELTRTRLPVTVSKMEIRQALDSLRFWLKENGSEGSNRAEAMVRLGKLRQAVGMSKVPLVVEMVEDILEQDETRKVVIYAVHKIVIEKLVESLKKWGVSTITGEVGQEERQHRVNRFQNHPTPRIMIISSAGGEGIDLFKAGQIIFAEREWTPAAEEQAEARCHRIGQKNAVEAIYLIAQDTVDSDIDYLIQRKRDVFKNLLAMDEITTTKNTIDEFLALVKGG